MIFQKADRDEWGSAMEAMQAALALEKNSNQIFLDLHKLADKHGDAQVRTRHITYIGSSVLQQLKHGQAYLGNFLKDEQGSVTQLGWGL